MAIIICHRRIPKAAQQQQAYLLVKVVPQLLDAFRRSMDELGPPQLPAALLAFAKLHESLQPLCADTVAAVAARLQGRMGEVRSDADLPPLVPRCDAAHSPLVAAAHSQRETACRASRPAAARCRGVWRRTAPDVCCCPDIAQPGHAWLYSLLQWLSAESDCTT